MTAPYRPLKPSILDRLASRLFPTLALMSPDEGQAVGRQGLLQVGTNLLQAGGASPQQQGTLANIGASIGGVDVNALTKQAATLQAYREQQRANQRIAEVAGANAPREGESPDQTYERIARMVGQLAGTPGTEDLIGKLSNVLAQLRPQAAPRPRYVFKELEDPPGSGKFSLFRVNEDDPTDRIRIGIGREPTGLTQPTGDERRAAALYTVGEDAYRNLRNAQAPNLKDYLAGKVPLGLGQAAISSRQQSQNQAGAQFYRSYLYIVSGATVNEGEALEAAKTFIPQWGDDPVLVQQKLHTQEVMLQAMRQARGRAGGPTPPPPSNGSPPSGEGGTMTPFGPSKIPRRR